MAKIHVLKTDSAVFLPAFDNVKRFEIRKDDRGVETGDTLILRETKHTGEEMAAGAALEYTGKTCARVVSHILRGPCYGLAEGWAIFSVRPMTNEERDRTGQARKEALK